MLQVAPNASNDRDFQEVKQAFAQQPAARSMGELAQRGGSGGGNGSGPARWPRPGRRDSPCRHLPRAAAPSAAESIFQVNVPDNWRTLSANSFIRYVPENAYGPMNGQNVLTHGVELGRRAGRVDGPDERHRHASSRR